jgi:outer membrane protein W
MRTRNFALAAVLLFATLPLAAQTPRVEIIGRAVWFHPTQGNSRFTLDDDFSSGFDSKFGYGLGLNIYVVGPLSVELSASVIKPKYTVQLFDSAGPASTRTLRTIPVTAGLQYHFCPGMMFDPYVGGGAVYVDFARADNGADLALDDVGSLQIDKNKTGWMANAGLTIGITRNFAANLDGKYLGVSPVTRVVFVRGDFTASRKIRFDPVLLSAGFSARF